MPQVNRLTSHREFKCYSDRTMYFYSSKCSLLFMEFVDEYGNSKRSNENESVVEPSAIDDESGVDDESGDTGEESLDERTLILRRRISSVDLLQFVGTGFSVGLPRNFVASSAGEADLGFLVELQRGIQREAKMAMVDELLGFSSVGFNWRFGHFSFPGWLLCRLWLPTGLEPCFPGLGWVACPAPQPWSILPSTRISFDGIFKAGKEDLVVVESSVGLWVYVQSSVFLSSWGVRRKTFLAIFLLVMAVGPSFSLNHVGSFLLEDPIEVNPLAGYDATNPVEVVLVVEHTRDISLRCGVVTLIGDAVVAEFMGVFEPMAVASEAGMAGLTTWDH
ncbi:hypothetical protein SUGI_0436310 [Cryptomeria japonica]|nr:hypothetical protein SUGI_0436310 [Cryptomeria japonica]